MRPLFFVALTEDRRLRSSGEVDTLSSWATVVVTVDLSCRLGVRHPRLASRTMHEYLICW